MNVYQKPYLKLFNSITDSIQLFESELAKLKIAQLEAEQFIINNGIDLETEHSG